MKKVITYGTYDLLHFGHIRLLERAKALGDYLIVGITSDAFDRSRGKINVQQSLMERIEAVKATGLADEIVIEEYEGQKIDDIKRLNVDIFTVGSDWRGVFDYLNQYCQVVYLDRTAGVSSTELRSAQRSIRVGVIGTARLAQKYISESSYVNGAEITALLKTEGEDVPDSIAEKYPVYDAMTDFLPKVDAVIVLSHPATHYDVIRQLLREKKHVLCEAPLGIRREEAAELFALAEETGCILYESVKTAYAMAFNRMMHLVEGGKIGDVVAVSATCTSLSEMSRERLGYRQWNSMNAWAPTALLPVLQLLGTDYQACSIVTKLDEKKENFDSFTKFDFIYPNAVATVLIGKQIKAEGELIISGTKGYVYVPAPWWKTDYFEIRYENASDNKRYFYPLDGEGIRDEIVSFIRSINLERNCSEITSQVTLEIAALIERFDTRRDISVI